MRTEELFFPENRIQLIETVVPIENKYRQIVPFILNPIQLQMMTGGTGRDVYVKPSQAGGTSIIMCDFLLDCLTVPGTTSVIISYDEFITGRLLRKAQAFYDNLSGIVPDLPQQAKSSTKEKVFEFKDKLGNVKGQSSFYIASAKGFSMPRGEPIHNLLLDELAFWPPDSATLAFAAALNRVPLEERTKVKALSTPNGEGNDFHEMYMAAKEGRATGNSVFTAHFYPWFALPEYSMLHTSSFVLPGDDTQLLGDLEPDEINLMVQFASMGIEAGEAHNKIRWRRYKIAEMRSLKRSGETAVLFSQEFPEDDVSCFLSAADEWYPAEEVNRLARMARPAEVHYLGADIWYLPEEGKLYLMAIDPGLGKKSDSVATIWTFKEGEYKHCATFAGKYAGKEMAERCFPLARFFNNAKIATEDTLDITAHLLPYGNLYYRTDPVTGMVGTSIGWQTTLGSKIYMCNELSSSMTFIITHDIRIPQQMRNIREGLSRGRVAPVSVGEDDYHDSAAIALVCRDSLPTGLGFVGAKGWPAGWGN